MVDEGEWERMELRAMVRLNFELTPDKAIDFTARGNFFNPVVNCSDDVMPAGCLSTTEYDPNVQLFRLFRCR